MEIVSGILAFTTLAIIVEGLTELVKQFFPSTIGIGEIPIALIISMVFGITIAVLTQVDLLGAFGLVGISPYPMYVITGIASAGGSRWAHELVSKLRASRQDDPDDCD